MLTYAQNSVHICTICAPSQVWDEKPLTRALQDVVEDLSDELCGLVAAFEELWYVEEQHLLALALGGTYVKHPSVLQCPGHRQHAQV